MLPKIVIGGPVLDRKRQLGDDPSSFPEDDRAENLRRGSGV
jgi:hypothetical protein